MYPCSCGSRVGSFGHKCLATGTKIGAQETGTSRAPLGASISASVLQGSLAGGKTPGVFPGDNLCWLLKDENQRYISHSCCSSFGLSGAATSFAIPIWP